MANCGKDTNGSQFNFQEPCQWVIVVKILMVQFNFQEPCQWLIVVKILMVQFNFQEPCQRLMVVKILMVNSLIFRNLVNG